MISKKTSNGFTLIELMVVVVIIGILGAIALPAYNDQMMKSRRTDGKIALMDMAANMERYFTENNTFVGATPAVLGISNTSPEGFYNMTVTAANLTSYTISAVPVPGGAQAGDVTCGTLALTNTGVKTPNPSVCW